MSDGGDAVSTAAAGKVVMPAAAGMMAAILRLDASMKTFRASLVCCWGSGWSMKKALRRSFNTMLELTVVEKCAVRMASAKLILCEVYVAYTLSQVTKLAGMLTSELYMFRIPSKENISWLNKFP